MLLWQVKYRNYQCPVFRTRECSCLDSDSGVINITRSPTDVSHSISRPGPVIASVIQPRLKNAIGTHNGSYSVYRSIAVAAGSVLVAGCCCTCLLVALPFMLVSQGSGMTLTLVSPFLATCAVLNKLLSAGKWIPWSGLIFTTPRLLSRSVQRLRGSTQPRSSRWIRGAT